MGISFSTKGFYGVGIICFAIFSHIIYTKKFNVIFSYKVLIGLAMFFLSITPVLYAYYVQFGIDGVNFILWNQNVERITAKGFTKNSPDYFFFFHSLLWTFLPWAFLMYYGLFYQIKKLIKNKFKSIKGVELLTIGGVLITLLIISFSKFKLPHYLNPLLALLSVFTAGVLYNLQKDNQQKTLKVFLGFIYFMITVLTIAVILILCFTFNTPSILTFIISCVLFLVLLFSLIQKKDFSKKIVINSVLLMVFINVVLNTYFYPELLQYQGGIKLATIVNQNDSINIKDVYFYENDYSWPLDFYTGRNTPHITKEELKNINKDVWIVIRNIPLEKVEEDGFIIKEKHRVDHFRVTRLSLKFLNPKTRDSKLGDAYLLKIASKKS